MTIDKFYPKAEAVLADLCFDGMTVMLGGFGLCGVPSTLIDILLRCGVKDITLISANCGALDWGADRLVRNGLVSRLITAYTGGSSACEEMALNGDGVEFVSQGLLAERIRAARAGIPAFYARSGIDSELAIGCERRVFSDKEYFLSHALNADLALIKAWKGDRVGNVVYRGVARNFNQVMAGAARSTVVELEKLCEFGDLDCNDIHTPNIYINRIIKTSLE